MRLFRRVVLIVLDSAGIGEMPDAAEWGDQGSDTIGHVLEREAPALPNLQITVRLRVGRNAYPPRATQPA